MENKNYSSSSEEETWCGSQKLQKVNGLWCMPMMIDGIQWVLNEFNPRPNDITLASFPKTGTTWLKSILFSIINRSSLDSLEKNHPHDLFPFLEVEVYAKASENEHEHEHEHEHDQDTPRLFNTHVPYQLFGKSIESSGCRVVYVTRNPKDMLNSLWHFANKWKTTNQEPWELEEAVEKFCLGVVPSGPYYEHVLGYRAASLENNSKVFFVTYEELMEDAGTHVRRLGEFLGCPFREGEDEKVDEIVKGCSFDVLSSHEVNKSEDCRSWFPMPNNSFFRRAKVGDHMNYFSDEIIERIDALTREKFHKSDFIYGI